MNSTTIATLDETEAIILFVIGCVFLLVSVVVILFARVEKTSCAYSVFKFIKVKCIAFWCCCCREKKKELVEKNAEELKELID